MKRVLIVVAGIISLTACAPNTIVVEVQKKDGECSMIVAQNKHPGRDHDNSFPFPCEITKNVKIQVQDK